MPSQPQPARGSFDAYVQDMAHLRGGVRLIVQRIAYDPDPAVRERFSRNPKVRLAQVARWVRQLRNGRVQRLRERDAAMA